MPRAQTGVEDLAEQTARRWCGRCDDLGFVWRRLDGSTTSFDDPEAVTAARCTHPRLFQVGPSVRDDTVSDVDELADV
jgi:hypothetical protein